MTNRVTGLLRQARERPDATAIIDHGRPIAFAELAERVLAAAGGLAAFGIVKGSRVGLMMPTQPEFIVVQQALFLLGAVVSPLNVFYRSGEVAHAVNSCELQFVVIADALCDRLALADRAAMPSLVAVIVADAAGPPAGFVALADACAQSQPIRDPVAVADHDLAMLLHTSATTGKSKGVMLTAGNLAANYDRTPGWLGLDASGVILCALPLYNTFGLNQCINAMTHTGAALVLLPRFDAAACIAAIRDHQCTFMPAVPTMLQKIVDHPGLMPGDLASLRRVMTGGAPVPAALLARVLAIADDRVEVLTGYGLTEATALVTLTRVTLGDDGDVVRGRTIGRVLDGMELGVVDDAGRAVASGEIGEFVVRGPNLMAGYYQAPADTAAALQGGWLHTGDLGTIDADGFAFIVDRKKDVIIRGGQNIYPADIEEVLYRVAGVAEAAVIGEPDEMLGEVPVAFVALRAGDRVSGETLLEACTAELARFKLPRSIHILPELPKGPTGKILRRALRGAVPAP
ncbi:class I adenylate-forming enzyme family protein [Novosphingobium lentum]|uniref:class I adenylate-forming enzyme family protein n=1 Tax=Novosphingobium lentum TaxID=145287 RepID=UPI0009FFF9CE|nr:AMP-binding protein [Novosphingobium lentum]